MPVAALLLAPGATIVPPLGAISSSLLLPGQHWQTDTPPCLHEAHAPGGSLARYLCVLAATNTACTGQTSSPRVGWRGSAVLHRVLHAAVFDNVARGWI